VGSNCCFLAQPHFQVPAPIQTEFFHTTLTQLVHSTSNCLPIPTSLTSASCVQQSCPQLCKFMFCLAVLNSTQSLSLTHEKAYMSYFGSYSRSSCRGIIQQLHHSLAAALYQSVGGLFRGWLDPQYPVFQNTCQNYTKSFRDIHRTHTELPVYAKLHVTVPG